MSCALSPIATKSKLTRTFSVPTLERWYYKVRRRGLAGLVPRPRRDKGHAQVLPEETRELISSLINSS